MSTMAWPVVTPFGRMREVVPLAEKTGRYVAELQIERPTPVMIRCDRDIEYIVKVGTGWLERHDQSPRRLATARTIIVPARAVHRLVPAAGQQLIIRCLIRDVWDAEQVPFIASHSAP